MKKAIPADCNPSYMCLKTWSIDLIRWCKSFSASATYQTDATKVDKGGHRMILATGEYMFFFR